MKKYINASLIIIALLFFVVAIFMILSSDSGNQKSESFKVGYLFPGKIDELGWNNMHYRGVKKACDSLGLKLVYREDVKEFTGRAVKAVEELINDGVTLIILNSFNHTEEVFSLIKKHPEVQFLDNSHKYRAPNLKSYFVRMYQGRYLAGVIAGLTTKTNNIGYVAAKNVQEVNRGISAFALGARKVNPDVKIWVRYTNVWDDYDIETQAAEKLINGKNVDILTYHQNKGVGVVNTADRYGVFSIGYHYKDPSATDRFLTAVVADWEMTYKVILQKYLQDKKDEINFYWLGMEDEAVKLEEMSPLVNQYIKRTVSMLKEKIINNNESVFSGKIYNNRHELMCQENEILSDEQLLEHFIWMAEGVYVYGD